MNDRMNGRGQTEDIHSNAVTLDEKSNDESKTSTSCESDTQSIALSDKENSADPQVDLVERAQSRDSDDDLNAASLSKSFDIDNNAAIKDVINEDTIAEFLSANPDFFRQRSDVLSKLQIPHVEGGQASSLIERQVSRLRLEIRSMQTRFDQVVESARLAEQQQSRVHRIALSLMAASTLEQVKEGVVRSLHIDLDIDQVELRLHSEIDEADTDAYMMLHDRVAQGRSFCDHRLPKKSMDWMFGELTTGIASCAVVPVIDNGKVLGLIGLGDGDADRFGRDMGTVYLDRLGELIGTVIARL